MASRSRTLWRGCICVSSSFASAPGRRRHGCSTSGRSRPSGMCWRGRCTSGAERSSRRTGSRRRGIPLGGRGDLSGGRGRSGLGPARSVEGPRTAALLGHNPRLAAESLGGAWAHTERVGVEEPGVFPFAPDLVEVLVEVGDVAKARAVSARLRELAQRQAHPWVLTAAKRCDGMIGLAGRAPGPAAELLSRRWPTTRGWGALRPGANPACARSRASPRQEVGRCAGCARAVGRCLRRTRLVRLGRGGEVRARPVGARRAVPAGALTPAETRVAALAVQGLANKEIARTLFVSVHTVEVHLSHVYAKLGVHSRTQLAPLAGAALGRVQT